MADRWRWYKAYPKMLDSKSGKRGAVYIGAMHWLLSSAEWRDDQALATGQLYLTEDEAATSWNVTKGQAHLILKNLVEDGFITINSTRKRGQKSIVTICKYDTYQNNSQTIHKPFTNNSQNIQNDDCVNNYKSGSKNTEEADEHSQTIHKPFTNNSQTNQVQDARVIQSIQNIQKDNLVITSVITPANAFQTALSDTNQRQTENHFASQMPLLFDGVPVIAEKPSETRSDGVSDTPAGDDTGKPQKAANSAIKRGSCKSSARPVPKFDYDTNEWLNITDYWIDLWHETFPALDVRAEILRMRLWLISHLQQKKKNFLVFINNWLTKEQDRGGRNNGWNTQYRPVAGAGGLDPSGRPEVIRGADYGQGADIDALFGDDHCAAGN